MAGTDGWCAPAYSCNATGDVCYRPEDCCSGLCTATGGQPGRCGDAPGGCTQDGVPCENATNCCTRLCQDQGSGTKVCQPAGGCRMTGNYCDSTDACCRLPGDRVQCEADHTCNNGVACNPPGNICGASTDVNASQNCCNGKKDVCKPDANGILRCFGGQTASCPTGWDATNPLCCIPAGDVCQFRDQCCGFAPCVPDAAGVLRCAATGGTCKPRGTRCAGTSDTTCCDELSCRDVPEIGFVCTDVVTPPPPTCKATGSACDVAAADCCSGLCTVLPGAPSGTCALCAPNGNACTTGGQCCSGTCEGGVCRTPCVPDAGACTVTADCCSGLTCDVPPGATSGTCTSGGTTCSATGQSCGLDTDCCDYDPAGGGDFCNEGICEKPATCSSVSQPCTSDANCCSGLQCISLDSTGNKITCTGTACFCDSPLCRNIGQSCTTTQTCCVGYCQDLSSTTGAPCTTSSTSCSCNYAL